MYIANQVRNGSQRLKKTYEPVEYSYVNNYYADNDMHVNLKD